MTGMLIREGVDARTLVQIYLAVVQPVMIYRSETWVMTLHIGRLLDGFPHRMARKLTGSKPQRGRDGVWVYPPLEDAMAEAVFQEVETYVSRL